ncbi:MAG: methionyl-tRNA formyltransferase [bacterium]|nr:methionyl-tRNA formyltransferase [bacterium]
MRILFMGTPDFASAVLNKMIEAGCEVVGAVSQPDKPKGRGHKLTPTDVKKAAEAAGISVYQPESLRNEALLPILDELKPEVIVVAAYGKILPSYILDYPKYGCINVHASLLPKYRGAAPIQRAIINGDKITGVTIMQMEKGLDTGDMLSKAETEIGEYETAEQLFDRLAVIGGDLLVKTLERLDNIIPEKQNDEEATYAEKISREDGRIDWTLSADKIIRLINGMNSWPLAYTSYKGEILKIAEAVKCSASGTPGEITELRKNSGLIVTCGEDAVCIKTAQFPGSRKMNVEDYARGHEIEIGTVLV